MARRVLSKLWGMRVRRRGDEIALGGDQTTPGLHTCRTRQGSLLCWCVRHKVCLIARDSPPLLAKRRAPRPDGFRSGAALHNGP